MGVHVCLPSRPRLGLQQPLPGPPLRGLLPSSASSLGKSPPSPEPCTKPAWRDAWLSLSQGHTDSHGGCRVGLDCPPATSPLAVQPPAAAWVGGVSTMDTTLVIAWPRPFSTLSQMKSPSS